MIENEKIVRRQSLRKAVGRKRGKDMLTTKQVKAIETMKTRKQEYIQSRVEDRHYSDSWEQSRQISEDIDRVEKEISAINDFLAFRRWNKSIAEIVRQEIRLRTFKYNQKYCF